MSNCGVYKITSPTGKIYIGQSVDIHRRKQQHKFDSKSNCYQTPLYSSFKKHGFENHKFEIEEECLVEELNNRERFWQDFYNSTGKGGLNCSLTKTSDKKYVHSIETISKISSSNTGKVFTDKHRENLKKSLLGVNKGKIFSEEHRVKIGRSSTGRVVSRETRLKISRANKGKTGFGNSKKVINTETKEVFESIKLASESISMTSDHLSNSLRGVVNNKTNFIYYEE